MKKQAKPKTGVPSKKSQTTRHRPTLAELRRAQLAASSAAAQVDELRRRVERAEREARQPQWLREAYSLAVRERDAQMHEAAGARKAHAAANARAESQVSAARRAESERDEARDAVRFLEGRAAELVAERDTLAAELDIYRVELGAAAEAFSRLRSALHLETRRARVEPGGCSVAGCSSPMCLHRACGLSYPGGSGFGCGLLKGHRGPCGAAS